MSLADSDIETLERVVGDLAQAGPSVKGFLSIASKYVRKQKIREMMQSGQHQLHLASTILEHKNVKTLLQRELPVLKQNYIELQERRLVFEESMKPLKAMDVRAKFKLAGQVSDWVNESTTYKHDVISQSDWAKLGLALRNGKLLPIKETLASPSEQTLVAPTSRNVDKTDDKDGDDDDDDHASAHELCIESLPYIRFDDIPIDETGEMQDIMSDGSGPSVPPKRVRFGKLLKGKSRA